MQKLSDIHGRPLHICLLMQREELVQAFQSLWPADEINWTVFSSGRLALERLFSDPPDMVIAEQFLPETNGIDVLSMLRAENIYRQICAILVAYREHLLDLPVTALNVDELVILPTSQDELRLRVELALHRTTETMDANPLTRLPGNTSIIHTVERLIAFGVDFSLAYVDMDNFKPYNDRYGFSRGDEVLLMAARVIANTVGGQRHNPSFVGHVGGDDFVFILPPSVVEEACASIVKDFDAIVPNFYDSEDRARGNIISVDRQGNEVEFPIMSVSIAVVPNIGAKFSRYAQISHAAGQLKKVAKSRQGSIYVIDRRQH